MIINYFFCYDYTGGSSGGGGGDAGSSTKKGQKRRNNAELYRDFTIDYAKSNRSACKGCEAPILKEEIRIAKKDYDSEMGQKLNGVDAWHHVDCFVDLRSTLGFFDSADNLPGFQTLTKTDQKLLKTKLKKIKTENVPPAPKKPKVDPDDAKNEQIMKQQNEAMFKLKDQLSTLPKKDLTRLLHYNDQHAPEGQARIINRLVDFMTFGVPLPCDKCGGNFKYVSGVGYQCTGDLTEWTKCENTQLDPSKKKFKIPSDLKEDIPFLGTFKVKCETRVFKQTSSSQFLSAVKKEDATDGGPAIKNRPLPLKGMQFIIHGRDGKADKDKKEEMRKQIMLLGGTVANRIHDNIAAVISSQEAFEKAGKPIKEAENKDIQVVSEDFIDEAKDYTDTPIALIHKKNISGWGNDPTKRVSVTMTKSSSSGKSVYEKISSGKVKLKIKGGGAIDPDTNLEDVAHIYQRDKNNIYNAILGLTDIQAGTNKFYKLQILKHDKKDSYWLFKSWGRIGTTIGGNRCNPMSLEDAIEEFEKLYLEKSGNYWSNRKHFVKMPKMMYPIDVDNPDDDEKLGNFESEITSNLKKPVQELIRLIFNVDIMKKVMAEYEIDLDKMPLGKLSKQQLQKAYSVLTELQALIIKEKSSPGSQRMFLIDASNRFYTLVPHSFGVAAPPILDNEILIKVKSEMLDSLIEMEIAYNLLNVKTDSTKNPLDTHYEQLNTEIDVLEKESEEFKLIHEYTKNTHGSTHSQYKLEIEDVFVIKRQGEDKRYKPFKKLHNRKLLWHGSRTTNFAGILSQGLRIAPPEAPVTGYMFGKGIYFADMVSKSANYCCASSQNSTGILMLCEVALGNMYERLAAEYVEKLPSGKHSTFGRGLTHPDPTKVHKTKDGVEVPYGPGVPAQLPGQSSLLYNEFIVYDVAQVKAQYLIRMKFKYDY